MPIQNRSLNSLDEGPSSNFESSYLQKIPRMRCLAIFGPPGAGKGLQSSVLKSYSSIYHLSTGDLFRKIPQQNSLAQLQREYLAKGNLVPDRITFEIVAQYLQGLIDTFLLDPDRHILLLDGIPRTPAQVELILRYFDFIGTISLTIQARATLIERLAKRAQEQGRSDDASPKVIENRLRVYEEQTKASLDAIESASIPTFHIDGDQPCALVTARILDKLHPYITP